jgi:hypothetical protein
MLSDASRSFIIASPPPLFDDDIKMDEEKALGGRQQGQLRSKAMLGAGTPGLGICYGELVFVSVA